MIDLLHHYSMERTQCAKYANCLLKASEVYPTIQQLRIKLHLLYVVFGANGPGIKTETNTRSTNTFLPLCINVTDPSKILSQTRRTVQYLNCTEQCAVQIQQSSTMLVNWNETLTRYKYLQVSARKNDSIRSSSDLSKTLWTVANPHLTKKNVSRHSTYKEQTWERHAWILCAD